MFVPPDIVAPDYHQIFLSVHGAIQVMNLWKSNACRKCLFNADGANELTILEIAYFLRQNTGWAMSLFSKGSNAVWNIRCLETIYPHHEAIILQE
jgi:hypothetical protein